MNELLHRRHFLECVGGAGTSACAFPAAGTWGYFCSAHPHMTGKVVVKAS